jgi:hypothetical protein
MKNTKQLTITNRSWPRVTFPKFPESQDGATQSSKFIVRSPSFAGFCELDRQVQFNCC